MAAKKERKMVTIHLFRGSGKYGAPVVVGDGKKLWAIKRGVDVEVPEHIAKILETSLKREDAVNELIYKKSKESEKLN